MIILLTWYVAHASGKQGKTHKVQYIIKHHKKQISSKVNTLVRHDLSPVSGERTKPHQTIPDAYHVAEMNSDCYVQY